MLNLNNTSVIFFDNPIGRAYLNYFRNNNLSNLKIKYLIKKKFFLPIKINTTLDYYKRYSVVLKYLKDENIISLIHQIEDFFNLDRNFISSMYDSNLLGNFNNIEYIDTENVNSKEMINTISNSNENDFYLNTTNQIYKEILKTNKFFIHIHPGFLPNVKGADGSLHSIDKHNHLGVSSFIIEKKIDEGKIIMREKLPLPKLNFLNMKDYKVNELYRIWFAFFDPLLRVYHLKNLYSQKKIISHNDIKKYTEEESIYYSFMEKSKIIRTLNKVIN